MGRSQELLDAARKGDRKTVEKILGQITKRSGPFTSLRRGAGVNVQDDSGYTPLHHASLHGQKEIVRLLLSVDASPCIGDKNGTTALHLAAFKGHADVVAMLLAHNNPPVNVDQLTSNNETALLMAAQFDYVEIVEQLFLKGADVNIRNKKMESALDLAAQYGRLKTVKFLLHVRPQLVAPYKPRQGRIFSSTPLHLASINGHKEVVLALLSVGVDPNIMTDKGTPLHEAARYGKASVVRILLDRGADLNAVDIRGKSVYDLLADYSEEATKRVKRVIRDYENRMRNACESEEDVPPFPVHDYSPTIYPHSAATPHELNEVREAKRSSNKNAFITNLRISHEKPQFNFDIPIVLLSSPNLISNLKAPNQSISQSSDKARSRSNTLNTSKNFFKANPALDSMPRKVSEVNDRVVNELKNKLNPVPRESLQIYENVANKNGDDSKRDNSVANRKRPKPPPKPNQNKAFSDEISPPEYINTINTCQDSIEVTNPCTVDEITKHENENIYVNNLPDDFKISLPHYELVSKKENLSIAAGYASMDGWSLKGFRRSFSDLSEYEKIRNDSFHLQGDCGCIYGSLHYMYTYALNHESLHGAVPLFIRRKEKIDPMPCFCHESKHRQLLSLKNNISLNRRYCKSEVYFSCEDVYVDVTDRKNAELNFIKRLHIIDDQHKNNVELKNNVNEQLTKKGINEDKKDDDTKTSLNVNDGCLFVPFETDNAASTSNETDNTNIRENKMAPETQKITNMNESLLSPSSSPLTKNHPQSFVKKLASKCLGLKAKFSSAPNISSPLYSEPTAKITSVDNKTNTMLIGNSKFFKRLSKKEDSGEIVCNDEFDTISLDRVAVLNRDCVVNRSNRSCPGFKTSLPHISENNELTDSDESIPQSLIIEVTESNKSGKSVELIEALNRDAKQNIFEPREKSKNESVTSIISGQSENFINECYESYEASKNKKHNLDNIQSIIPKPQPRIAVPFQTFKSENIIYENVEIENKNPPVPATRVNVPSKNHVEEVKESILYENVKIVPKKSSPPPPPPPMRSVISSEEVSNISGHTSSPSLSRSSTLSSDSMIDESNLEDILLSEKSKSFRHRKKLVKQASSASKSGISRTSSNSSEITEVSAIENVDCSETIYMPMTGTLPSKKAERAVKKKVLFRHKTFTNIEIDGNLNEDKNVTRWDSDFMKETLPNYHIRGTGHCIHKSPTVQEFIYIFNRETLYGDVEPFTKVPSNKRESYFETAICFCKPRPPKHHNSADDLLEIQTEEEKVTIDIDKLEKRREILTSSFSCFCDSGTCTLHAKKRECGNNLIVKFSAIKKSISTPNITLDPSSLTKKLSGLVKNKTIPSNLEDPYAVVNIESIIGHNRLNNGEQKIDDKLKNPIYETMSQNTTMSSSTSARPYSIKDIAEVISLNDNSTLSDASLSCASESPHLPLRPSSSSEYSGKWSLQSCQSNVTIKSDASFVTCEESSDEDSDAETLHTDDENSDTDTIKSEVSTARRPWVHSDSFNFGNKNSKLNDVIAEEDSSSLKSNSNSLKLDSSSKLESGIGSESWSSGCDEDGSVSRVDGHVSLGVASLEPSGGFGDVCSGLGRRRWEEADGTSEGDALSVSSAASSCAPLHLLHHHEYSKISPTPPKKPPRRNLSVSPTHVNSPSSGYSYELRTHARSQDDLDDIQSTKHYLKHGRSIDQYVDGKLSYSEYEENHNSPRVAPIPNPRPSLKNRTQPVAITAMYENYVIKEQNPRRKLRRNNFQNEAEPRMGEVRVRKYSNQERSSLESLLDDQSMYSPSDCERYCDGQRVDIPLSPTHYDQPPTPDHPPPSARQAERSIHERIRPLSQEYKRRSMVRDNQTEVEVNLLRAISAASVASGATDRSGNTDNCVEEYVCDVPFAGLFKGSTTTLDGIGLRPMPAERPKTLRKLKSVYDASPIGSVATNTTNPSSNGQVDRNVNGCEEEVRRRSNTTSSTHSADKSLSILSPFDEQEEWAKISEIMASFGSKLVRESVFVSELEQEFTSRLGLSCSESSLSPSTTSTLGLWLSGLGLHDYEPLFVESGFDDIDFINGVISENDLREMGIEENDRQKILESAKQLPLKIAEISNNHNNNNISKNQNESVEEWLKHINLEIYNDTFRKHLYVDMDRVRRIWEVELTAVLEIQKAGHRKRILASVSGEQNGPANNMEDISADLNTLKNNIQQLKEEIKEKLPPSENLKAVPPPVVPTLAPPGGETLKRSKKNRPAPQPPRPADLEIRAPSELLVGVPGALKTQWKHKPFVLVTGAVTYVANYLGSTVVKELRGTESTKKSIQKLKKCTKEPRDSPDIILSISYRGVKFLNTITRELVCEHEIRNIHCACQDADDLTHFAYITKDHTTRSHYCHVFRVATMDQATEVILTLGEAFEVAYQMALREQSNRSRVTQSQAKTPTHDPMTTTTKEKPNVNHGRSHSITEIKLNGHQLKIAPIPASLSNEDFQSSRNSDGSRSPRTPLLKAPIASTEEL